MAQETILKVSLRDYKKGIDDLRASLLGLDKDSEEYGRIVEQIAERQDKLNDAMNAGKQTANAVDGSYNALVATLSKLKREWRNIEIGTPEWEAMAVRIDEINEQLKDADAKVGVFTRNVGDYANAFEEGFKQAMGGLSKMPGALGQIGGMTKQLIPLIKQTTNTAVAGLTGVRKAIASTGIGVLIVAVGLLIANFDKLTNLFKRGKSSVEQYTKQVKTLKEYISKTTEDINKAVAISNALGEDRETQLKTEKEGLQKELDEISATYQKGITELKKLEEMGWKPREEMGWFQRLFVGKDDNPYETVKKNLEDTAELWKTTSARIEVINASLEGIKRTKAKETADNEKKLLDEVLKRVKENSQTEIEKLTEKYYKEKALLEKYHKDTTLLTEQYTKTITEINEKALDSITSELMKYQPFAHLNREYRKAVDVLEKFQQIVNRTFPPEAILKTEDITEDMIKKAQKLGLVAGDTAEEFSYAWEYAYENFKGTSNNFAISMAELTSDYNRMQENFQKSNNLKAFYWNQLGALTEVYGFFERNITKIQLDLHKFEHGLETSEDFMSDWEGNTFETTEAAYAYWDKFVESLIKKWNEVGIEMNIAKDDMHNYAVGVMNELNNAEAEFAEFGNDSNWQWFTSTSFIYDAYQKRLDAAIWYRDNLEVIEGETESQRLYRYQQAENEILKIKREYAQKHIEVSQNLNSHLTSLWGSLIDIRESNMKRDEKTDKEIFEKTKDSKKGLAIVETIQGALAAFMGYQQYPQPYGAILGAAAAAATAAAGAAQIAAIEATQFDSAGNNVSNPTAVINATPRLADYQPDMAANLTGASETQNLANALQQTPIYVKITDIDSMQNTVKARDAEASF